MMDKIPQAFELSQQDVIDAAEKKLGRVLTNGEREGIQHIGSLMMLESICQAFASSEYSVTQVLADLEHFKNKA